MLWKIVARVHDREPKFKEQDIAMENGVDIWKKGNCVFQRATFHHRRCQQHRIDQLRHDLQSFGYFPEDYNNDERGRAHTWKPSRMKAAALRMGIEADRLQSSVDTHSSIVFFKATVMSTETVDLLSSEASTAHALKNFCLKGFVSFLIIHINGLRLTSSQMWPDM